MDLQQLYFCSRRVGLQLGQVFGVQRQGAVSQAFLNAGVLQILGDYNVLLNVRWLSLCHGRRPQFGSDRIFLSDLSPQARQGSAGQFANAL